MQDRHPRTPGTTGWTPGQTVAWVIGFLIVYAIVQIPILKVLKAKSTWLERGDWYSIATTVTFFVLVPLVIWVARRRPWTSWQEDLGFRVPKWNEVLLWLAAALAWSVFHELVLRAGAFSAPEWTRGASKLPILTFVVAVFLQPIQIELIMRGFAFRGLRRADVSLAIAVPALIWTSMYVPLGVIEMGVIFLFALLLGMARWKTGSVWMAMLMCSANNLYWLLRIFPMREG